MKRKLLLTGILLAMFAVLGGAFGSHALKNILSPEELMTYETAVRYQMYHSLAILFTAFFITGENKKYSSLAGIFFTMGIIFFSGSLYIITFLKSQNTGISTPVALATPLGGILFMCGWISLAVAALKNKSE
jgi:uncharacterized membrane protein YgdD (TMEM256/DUF423 family)